MSRTAATASPLRSSSRLDSKGPPVAANNPADGTVNEARSRSALPSGMAEHRKRPTDGHSPELRRFLP